MLAVTVALAAASIAFVAAIPTMMRQNFERASKGAGLSGGVLNGMNTVWSPTAYDAAVAWEAQTVVPAPAPIPGDKGRYGSLEEGVIRIELAPVQHPQR